MKVVTITDAAMKELKKVLEDQKLEDQVLRVGVTGGGCSGFMYSLNFDEASNVSEETDSVTEQDGIKVVVDKKSALFLDGTTLDFHEDLDQRGFVFDNPNATKTCGCNKSFQA